MAAHAPYNFVPLPDRVIDVREQFGDPKDPSLLDVALPSHDVYLTKQTLPNGETIDRHSGYFDVKMTTESPLYVRGMLTIDEARAQLNTAEFQQSNPKMFTANGQVRIPGSSLRGMIRQIVEIITCSKMSRLSDRLLLYRAVGDTTSLGDSYREKMLGPNLAVGKGMVFEYPLSTVKAGYLKKLSGGRVGITPAKEHFERSFVLVDKTYIPNGDKLYPNRTRTCWVKPAPVSDHVNSGLTLKMAQTYSFELNDPSNDEWSAGTLVTSKTIGDKRHWYPVIYEADLRGKILPVSEKVWQEYCDDRDAKKGIPARKVIDDGDALFYVLDDQGEILFLGPTMMFRVPYKNRIKDLLPYDHKTPERVDFASALFGFVAEDKKSPKQAFASRISITDATPIAENIQLEEVYTLPILLTPKPTSHQLYLHQPEAKLKHYDTNGARLRGNKLYWRRSIQQMSIIGTRQDAPTASETFQTSVQAVPYKTEFTFRVNFDNLTDIELGALASALELAVDGAKKPRHQLGMGKPLGMGVVWLQPKLYLIDRHSRYRDLIEGIEDENLANDTKEFIETFKIFIQGTSPGYSDRMVHFAALLNLYEPNGEFSTMGIKEFKKREVLPYANDVADLELALNDVESQQRIAAGPKMDVLEIGAFIRGSVFDSDKSTGNTWFAPKHDKDSRLEVTEAVILGEFPHKQKSEGSQVWGEIIDIDTTRDPIVVVCRPYERRDSK